MRHLRIRRTTTTTIHHRFIESSTYSYFILTEFYIALHKYIYLRFI